MATYSQIKHDAEETLKILRRPSVQALMRKHPDADWRIVPSNHYYPVPQLFGEIHIGYVDSTGLDIRDCANMADNDSWVVRQEILNKRQRGLQIQLVLVAYQSYSEEEKTTLRALGRLQTHITQPSTYESLSCER